MGDLHCKVDIQKLLFFGDDLIDVSFVKQSFSLTNVLDFIVLKISEA
jgi:hypothetical protein